MPVARLPKPGLFVTGTDTDVGKTVIAAAIALSLRQAGERVAVLKPVATGCRRDREGLISDDAELLAAASDTSQPLDLICPNRYAEPLAPSVAARRTGRPIDYGAIDNAARLAAPLASVFVVEGAGGVLTPLDDRHTVADLAAAMGAPAVIVARSKLGTINHTLLSIDALRARGVAIAGVVLNGYPTDDVPVAEETAAAEIERHGRVVVLAIAPHEAFVAPHLPGGVLSAIARVDWAGKMSPLR
jgi:dethiobiotin synthetase